MAAKQAENAHLSEEWERLQSPRRNRERSQSERDQAAMPTEIMAMDQSVPLHSDTVNTLHDPRFGPLAVDYSCVDPIYFRQIADNIFDPMDI